MSGDKNTLAVYAARAEDYAHLTRKAAEDPLLHAFIEAMPQGAAVLDLGCGPGNAAAAMAEAGLAVTATDAVPEMVALAARHPGVTAQVATFDDITGDALYDGVWANFSLLHAEPQALPRHLTALAHALKPGGRLHVAMKTGEGAHRDDLGRHYTYVTETGLSQLLSDAGLTPVATTTGADKGLDGKLAPWVAITAEKPADA
ncbi:class I SAM-dependent methyltransferase [Roseovarius aestuariivivens]|uniref:class I SAM-dependent methyltransferase n=1 Tax=Roseovarius aestuariivivens TaxID=1888910 RepID=UPI0010820F67|nr:class I SAM-dependent methyltransferase [Roseovarius aestuariivivens]